MKTEQIPLKLREIIEGAVLKKITSKMVKVVAVVDLCDDLVLVIASTL